MPLISTTSEHSQQRDRQSSTPIGKHSGALHVLFYLGLALLTCHELDAVARHEWRLLPGLNGLDDELVVTAFVLLHIPIFVALFWLSGHRSDTVRLRSQLAIDAFLLIHALMHFAMADHALYEFSPPVETITIYGGALVGLTHAILVFWAMKAE